MRQVVKAIGVVENWAARTNMEVNKKKSGVMRIGNDEADGTKEILGYPVQKNYKYLGLHMSGKLDLDEHLRYINRRAGFACAKLYGVRKFQNVRINRGLFETYIMPLYRLAMTVYARQSKIAARKIITHQKVWLKKFIMVPINTADATLKLMVGDIQARCNEFARRVRVKLRKRLKRRLQTDKTGMWQGQVTEGDEGIGVNAERPLRYLPSNLSKTLRLIYGSRCREHGMVCITTSHLRDSHNHNINIPELLVKAQKKHYRMRAKWELSQVMMICQKVKVARPPRLGRPKGAN